MIIYENDVHCAADGYAKLTTIREQQKALTPYVTTVSCGDFIQGDVVGAISTGEHIIDIMNQVNYDYVTSGNHEFDFGVTRMFELLEKLDAHSHSYIPDTLIYNGAGQPVLMSSTDTKFQGVGVLTLSPEGNFSTRIESLENVAPDTDIQAFVDKIKAKVESEGNTVMGRNEFSLPTHGLTGIRMVRNQETAIGNFCADAFRIVLDTDRRVLNHEGAYEPIDLTRTYTIAGFNYHLVDGGGQGILNGAKRLHVSGKT